jgi:hypothetical protein
MLPNTVAVLYSLTIGGKCSGLLRTGVEQPVVNKHRKMYRGQTNERYFSMLSLLFAWRLMLIGGWNIL